MAQSYARIKAKQGLDKFMDSLAGSIDEAVSRSDLSVSVDVSMLSREQIDKVFAELVEKEYGVMEAQGTLRVDWS